MKAADIMSTHVINIDSLATILEASQIMKQHELKTLIVDRASPDDAYGIITQTDIARAIAEGKDPLFTSVCEVMSKPCIVVNPDLPVEQIPPLFAKAKIRVAPVIKDQLLGIISVSDILSKTDYLSQNKVSLGATPTPESGELSAKKIMDWEKEFDNWCSG